MTFLFLLEGIRTPFLNQLMQFITYFGQELIVIAVICTFYWCADKRFAYLLGFTYFTAGRAGVENHIPYPQAMDFGPNISAGRQRRFGSNRLFLPKRPYPECDLPLLPPVPLCFPEMGQAYVRHRLSAHRIFQNVFGMPHSERRLGVYGPVPCGFHCHLEIPVGIA